MSRYRKTMREALEEMQANEGRMKDIYSMQQDGATAKEIAKKMNLPISTVKDILGEAFTKKDFDKNEDENEHTKNSYELAKMFGDSSEKSRMTRLYNKTRQVGSFLTKAENDYVTMIQTKYYRKLKEEVELNEYTSQQIKQAYGILNDPRYKGGDYTGAVKAIEKLAKGLSKHPDVANALMRANEEKDLDEGKFTLPTRYVVVDTRTNTVTHAGSDDKDLKLDVGRKSHLKIVKLKKPVSQKKTGYLLGEPLKAWGEEVLEENLSKAANELERYTMLSNRSMDKADFMTAVRLMRKGDKTGLSMHTKSLDTEPRDHIIMTVKKHLGKSSTEKIFNVSVKTGLPEEVELTEYFATVHSKKPAIVKFINANKKNIDYVDIDAGSNIEFEGKGAHELADKVKAKFGVRVTKEEAEKVELNGL